MRLIIFKSHSSGKRRLKVVNCIAILVTGVLLLGSCATERAVRLRDKSIKKWEADQQELEPMAVFINSHFSQFVLEN